MSTKPQTKPWAQQAPSFVQQQVQASTIGSMPFDVPTQGVVLKILLTDRQFGSSLAPHVKPVYFQNQQHQWMWSTAQAYRQQFGQPPSWQMLMSCATQLQPGVREVCQAIVAQVRDAPVLDEEALRAMTVEFIRRAAWIQAALDMRDLLNAGEWVKSYDLMKQRTASLDQIGWEPISRGWLMEEFQDRMVARLDPGHFKPTTTGIPEIDHLMGGGNFPGQMSIWMARAKKGKTTFLVNLGANAVRLQYRNVWHGILEGDRPYVENRYDTILLDELYMNVKQGTVDAAKYARAVEEATMLRGKVVVRDMTTNWATNAEQIEEEFKDLHRQHGWRPDIGILDYVQLLRTRPGVVANTETEIQRQAGKDCVTLAKRWGISWHTAVQAQRPSGKDWREEPSILTSAEIADAYDLVRSCTFLASINQTDQEVAQKVMRIFVELGRELQGSRVLLVHADFSKMLIAPLANPGQFTQQPPSPHQHAQAIPLGYGAMKQLTVGK